MRYGLDYLAGAKFKQVILAEHPNGWGAGFFANVDGFGNSYSVVEALLATGRCPFIRMQLKWDDGHHFSRNDRKFIETETKRFKPLVAKYQNVEWYFSVACEHGLKESDHDYLCEGVKQVLGDLKFKLVNSPNVRSGFVSNKYVNEYHGAEPKPRAGGAYSFSHDGTNCVDSDMESYKKEYANSEYFFIWNSQMNGNRTLKPKVGEKPTPRPQRTFYPVVGNQMDSWVYLSRQKGETKNPKGWKTFKSHGDQHTLPPAGKDQKPCIITELNHAPKKIVLKARNGQEIATAGAKMSYDENGKQTGWRYYLPDWGFILAEKARRIQGDGVCEVWEDGKKNGTINPAFRDVTYR